MSTNLASIREQLSIRLSDQNGLVYPSDTLDEAIRAALVEISRVYGEELLISGLDEALSTTLPESHVQPLLIGAVAFALRFRASGQFEPVSDDSDFPEALLSASHQQLNQFKEALEVIRKQRLQESTDSPHSQWEWDEGTDFE